MKPELRQAIIKANPDYFSWDKDHQEKYGQAIPKKEYQIIRNHLYQTLFDITVRKNDKDVDEQCTPEQTFLFNQVILPLMGVGENCFYLNESIGDQGILDFETWYNYDFHDHGYQESFSDQKSGAIKP